MSPPPDPAAPQRRPPDPPPPGPCAPWIQRLAAPTPARALEPVALATRPQLPRPPWPVLHRLLTSMVPLPQICSLHSATLPPARAPPSAAVHRQPVSARCRPSGSALASRPGCLLPSPWIPSRRPGVCRCRLRRPDLARHRLLHSRSPEPLPRLLPQPEQRRSRLPRPPPAVARHPHRRHLLEPLRFLPPCTLCVCMNAYVCLQVKSPGPSRPPRSHSRRCRPYPMPPLAGDEPHPNR